MGYIRRDNADMSSENNVKIIVAGSSRVFMLQFSFVKLNGP